MLSLLGFCLRFAEEFEVNLDDWKPDNNGQPVMNACIVEKGTYKVCTKTSPKSVEGQTAFQVKLYRLIFQSITKYVCYYGRLSVGDCSDVTIKANQHQLQDEQFVTSMRCWKMC